MRQSAAADTDAGQRADRRALAEVADLIDDGVYDAASVLAWEIQRSSPGDPSVWLLLARIDLLRERHAAAIYAARMATRLDPSSADAWIVLAQTAVRRERWWTEGLDAALQATALTPDDAEPWTALARLQLAAGERYDAAVSAERAVRVDDAHRGAHLVLGQIALEAQEWQHAATAFRRALELDGDDRDARIGLATALEAQDVDPSAELARYGSHVVLRRRGNGLLARVPWVSSVQASPLVADNRRLLLVVGACLVAGLVIGAVVPELGAGRGLVGAIAVVLMWFAIRPLRGRRGADAEIVAGEATRDEVVEAAVEQSAGDDESVVDGAGVAAQLDEGADADRRDGPAPTAELPEGEWGPAEIPPEDDGDEGPVGEAAGPDAADVPADDTSEDDGGDEAVGETPGGSLAAADGDEAQEAVVDPVPGTGAADDETSTDDTDAEVDGAAEDAAPIAEDQDEVVEAVDDVTEPAAQADVEPPAVTDDAARPADAGGAEAGAPPDGADATFPDHDPPPRPLDSDPPPATPRPESVELPHDPDALIELSRERLAASDLEVAHAAASRLEAVAPGTVEAHRALGAVSLAEHDYDQAREHYRKILELEPLDQEAHERLAMIGEQRPRGRMRRLMGWR